MEFINTRVGGSYSTGSVIQIFRWQRQRRFRSRSESVFHIRVAQCHRRNGTGFPQISHNFSSNADIFCKYIYGTGFPHIPYKFFFKCRYNLKYLFTTVSDNLIKTRKAWPADINRNQTQQRRRTIPSYLVKVTIASTYIYTINYMCGVQRLTSQHRVRIGDGIKFAGSTEM
jgi:hypothetical protein